MGFSEIPLVQPQHLYGENHYHGRAARVSEQGIDSILNTQIADYGGKHGVFASEMSWVLKANEAMSKLAKVIGGTPYKEYVIYEKRIG